VDTQVRPYGPGRASFFMHCRRVDKFNFLNFSTYRHSPKEQNGQNANFSKNRSVH